MGVHAKKYKQRKVRLHANITVYFGLGKGEPNCEGWRVRSAHVVSSDPSTIDWACGEGFDFTR
jgi:hypothetical protein